MSSLPSALAGLPESPQPLGPAMASWCTLHGPAGASCEACDEHFPDDVEKRKLSTPQVGVGGLTTEALNAMIAKAVAEAVAFERFKNSAAGRRAAAEAPTGKVKPIRKAAITKAGAKVK